MQFPKQTYEVTLHVGACTWDDLLRELLRTADHVQKHGPICNMSSGGYGVGSYVLVEHHPAVTLESFVESIEKWRVAPETEVWALESGTDYVIPCHVTDEEAIRLVRAHQREHEGIGEDSEDYAEEPSVDRCALTWCSHRDDSDRKFAHCTPGELGSWGATWVSW